jgi:hypothetical protein
MIYTIIPDIHNKIEKVNEILANNQDSDKFIFLGDEYDSIGDSPSDAARTTRWLLNTIELLGNKSVFLLGNHTAPYFFPNNQFLRCPGWNPTKQRAVDEIFGPFKLDLLTKYFQISHVENVEGMESPIIFSHAGFACDYFGHPIYRRDYNFHKKWENKWIEAARGNLWHGAVACGRGRGGRDDVPGPLWADWREVGFLNENAPNNEGASGFHQICGHSESKRFKINYLPNIKCAKLFNFCLDTGLRWHGRIESGDDGCRIFAVNTETQKKEEVWWENWRPA